MKRVLHVGCADHLLPDWCFPCEEVRLDIDPAYKPDIVASMTDMGDIGQFDGIHCSHSLEHLYPHDIPKALSEFYRVLEPGGWVVIFVPDLEDIKPTEDVLYFSPSGPVTGLDLIYGVRPSVAESLHMAHHFGFVASTLRAAMENAGFGRIEVKRLSIYNLMGAAVK